MTVSRERVRGAAANALGRLNKPRAYRARHGIGRGLKQIGGVGLILPEFLRPPPEYPELAGREEAFLRDLDLEGQTIYDIGAFVGEFTLFFAQRVGPRGRVVAFEPHPRSFRRTVEHVRLNGFSNVTVRNVGIGRERGELRLAAPAAGLGQASADEGIKRELAARGEVEVLTVPVSSLDEEIRDSSLPDPDLVKIDVEGLEVDVLAGMRATIERRRPRLFIEIHGEDADAKRANARGVIETLTEHGYSIRHVESNQAVDLTTAERAIRGHLFCA